MIPHRMPSSRWRTVSRAHRFSSGTAVAVHVRRRRAAATSSRAVLPRRHDHPGLGAGLGCRHSHGLHIAWSARHGATSILPELPKAVIEFPEPAATPERAQASTTRSERPSLRARGARRRGDRPNEQCVEGDAQVRLLLLRTILCLGAAMLFGSGVAVAVVRSSVQPAAVAAVGVMTMVSLLALRGTPGAARALRLDRVLPPERSSISGHSLSPISRTGRD